MRAGGSPYVPGSTLETSQFEVPPFQRFEIDLTVDRRNGAFIPEIQGQSLYVEAADFPVAFALVGHQTYSSNKFIARVGQQIVGPFKGISVTHPALTAQSFSSAQPKLVLICAASRDVDYTNQIAKPDQQWQIPWFSTTGTTTAGVVTVLIPPGSRSFERLSVFVPATTVTSMQWSMLANGGQAFTTSYTDTAGVVYGANPIGGYMKLTVVGPSVVGDETNIVIPSWVGDSGAAKTSGGQFQISIAGTGLVANGAGTTVIARVF